MTDVMNISRCTAFENGQKLTSGALSTVARTIRERGASGVLVFDDETGRVVDLDLRGSAEDVAARYAPKAAAETPRGRGRPKLGVVPREVTLLPRHWEWLNAQTGGASAALRRLVDEARKADGGRTQTRMAQERTYRFLTAVAGDLNGYEAVVRSLFAGDLEDLQERMADWPADIRDHARHLLTS